MKTEKRPTMPADREVRNTLKRMFAAWSDADPAQAAPFYAKDPGLTFFDVTPMKFTGWAELAAEVPKALADYRSLKLTTGDLRVHRSGKLAWATATLRVDLTRKDGGADQMEVRYTVVLEKRGRAWLVVHEHLSVPAGAAQNK